jgi:hypothetical protein
METSSTPRLSFKIFIAITVLELAVAAYLIWTNAGLIDSSFNYQVEKNIRLTVVQKLHETRQPYKELRREIGNSDINDTKGMDDIERRLRSINEPIKFYERIILESIQRSEGFMKCVAALGVLISHFVWLPLMLYSPRVAVIFTALAALAAWRTTFRQYCGESTTASFFWMACSTAKCFWMGSSIEALGWVSRRLKVCCRLKCLLSSTWSILKAY